MLNELALFASRIAILFVVGLLGLIFGSFLGLVVYRVPRKLSIVKPRSRCTNCGYELGLMDNVPVLSWVFLKGKCRRCGTKISARYPAAEILTAALWVGATIKLGTCDGCHPMNAVAFLPFFWALICLSLIDLEHKLIPNRILYPFLAIGGGLILIAALSGPGIGAFVRAALAGLASFAVFNVIHLISPAGMGYGDVRLSGFIGLYLGYIGWGHVYAGFLAGFVFGAVIGILLILIGKAGRKTAVPFGPFLAAGAAVSVFWGEHIIKLWTR